MLITTILTKFFFSHSLTDQASPDEGGGVVGGAPGGPLGAGGGPGAQPVPPQPLFHPDDVNVQSLAGLTPHLQINPQVGNDMIVTYMYMYMYDMHVHVHVHVCADESG